MLINCSWCNRVKIEEDWLEIDKAIKRLGLCEKESYPRFSHGMCPDCYLLISKTLDETE